MIIFNDAKDFNVEKFDDEIGLILFSEAGVVNHRLIGTCVSRKRVKKLIDGNVLMIEQLVNEYSDETITYLLHVSPSRLKLDASHGYKKLILKGNLVIRKTDEDSKVFNPMFDYDEEQIGMIPAFFKVGGMQYFIRKIKEFQSVDTDVKSQLNLKKHLVLDEVSSFKIQPSQI